MWLYNVQWLNENHVFWTSIVFISFYFRTTLHCVPVASTKAASSTGILKASWFKPETPQVDGRRRVLSDALKWDFFFPILSLSLLVFRIDPLRHRKRRNKYMGSQIWGRVQRTLKSEFSVSARIWNHFHLKVSNWCSHSSRSSTTSGELCPWRTTAPTQTAPSSSSRMQSSLTWIWNTPCLESKTLCLSTYFGIWCRRRSTRCCFEHDSDLRMQDYRWFGDVGRTGETACEWKEFPTADGNPDKGCDHSCQPLCWIDDPHITRSPVYLVGRQGFCIE